MTTTEGLAPFGDYNTWYHISGDLKSGKRPLIGLHGGPAATHAYMLALSDLAPSFGIPVVLYDQIGCGKSTWLPDKGADFWTADFFLSELDNLLKHLGIVEHDILGHSWGAILATEHALRQPIGLQHMILVGGPSDMSVTQSEINRLLAGLPTEVQEAIKKHEDEGTMDAPEYHAASQVFYAKHVCRIQPMPKEIQETFAALGSNPHVYVIMNGPCEFRLLGTLKDWKVTDRIHLIKTRTLLINGKFDEVTDKNLEPFVAGLADVKWVQLEESSHMPMWEEREKFITVVGDFVSA